MANLTITAQPRTRMGRKVRALREAGQVPVVVYGRVAEPISLQVNGKEFERALAGGGNSQLIEVTVEGGETHNVLVREIQRHPLRHHLMHADFYAISMTELQTVSVPIVALGHSSMASDEMILLQAMDAIDVEALPADIPAHIEVDIAALTLDDSITVADLPVIPGVEYQADATDLVFSLVLGRQAEEEEEEEELDMEDLEPEVISRGRDEDEEDG